MAKVVVLGSLNEDIVVTTAAHPQPGETVAADGLSHLPGGKGANQAVAAACAGAETHLIGAVGDDAAGSSLRAFVGSKGVHATAVRTITDAPTGTALIVVDAHGENTIVVVSGANAYAKDDGSVSLSEGDVLVSQLEVPVPAVVDFFRRGRANGCTTVLNAAPAASLPDELIELVDICVVNETELALLTGYDVNEQASVDDIASAARQVNVPHVIVTLGDRGALVVDEGSSSLYASPVAQVVDTTGAGDCHVGSVAAQLAQGEALGAAVDYANKAAAISVTRTGAAPSMPTRTEVLGETKPTAVHFDVSGLPSTAADIEAIASAVEACREQFPPPIVVAIGGCGGAGKTTLARQLAERLAPAHVVHIDDFSRPGIPGWDRARFMEQVAEPLVNGERARYQRYDWDSDRLADWRSVGPKQIVILEGVDALTVEFGVPFALSIWVDAPRELRLARGLARDGEDMRAMWTDVWMAGEDAYVGREYPFRLADMVVNGALPATE
jgi:ribokinase